MRIGTRETEHHVQDPSKITSDQSPVVPDSTLQHLAAASVVTQELLTEEQHLFNILDRPKYQKQLTVADFKPIRTELLKSSNWFRRTFPRISNFFRPDALEKQFNRIKELHSLLKTGDVKTAQQKLNDIHPSILQLKHLDGATALIWAAASGYTEIAQALIDQMTPEQIALQSENGKTALIAAASKGHTNIVKALIDQMTPEQIALQSKDGATALIWAAAKGYIEISQALIDQMTPEQIALQSKDGDTALIWAAAKGYIEIAQALIDKMTPEQIALQTKNFWTALKAETQRNNAKQPIRDHLLQIGTKESFEILSTSDNPYRDVFKIIQNLENNSNLENAIALNKRIPGIPLLEQTIEDYWVRTLTKKTYPEAIKYLEDNPECEFLAAAIFQNATTVEHLSEKDARALSKKVSDTLATKKQTAKALQVSHLYLADYLNRTGKKDAAFEILMEGFDEAMKLTTAQRGFTSKPATGDYDLRVDMMGHTIYDLIFPFLGMANAVLGDAPEESKQKRLKEKVEIYKKL